MENTLVFLDSKFQTSLRLAKGRQHARLLMIHKALGMAERARLHNSTTALGSPRTKTAGNDDLFGLG
eukprot:11057100-Alexandrium_andersonii.AAC.1